MLIGDSCRDTISRYLEFDSLLLRCKQSCLSSDTDRSGDELQHSVDEGNDAEDAETEFGYNCFPNLWEIRKQ